MSIPKDERIAAAILKGIDALESGGVRLTGGTSIVGRGKETTILRFGVMIGQRDDAEYLLKRAELGFPFQVRERGKVNKQ